jgi:mono/diheme cytochrome c family protein
MTRGGMSLVLSCAMVLGCSKTPPAPPRAGGSEVGSGSATAVVASKLIDFENGLTRQQREEFYHLAEGSEVFPLDWLQAIDNVHTGRRFLTDVERFGLIPDPDNSDGLPIGLTGASSRGLPMLGRMVGVNCAACHVGQVSFQGSAIRLDGAPNLFDARKFFTELADSAEATFEHPTKLFAFLSRLKASGSDADASDAQRDARELTHSLADESSKLREQLLPHVDDLIAKEKAHKPHELFDALKTARAEAHELRAKLLGDFSLPERIHELGGIKDAIEAVAKRVDSKTALKHTMEDIAINLRLLHARVEFLKRLAFLGGADITEGGPGRVDAFGTARYWLFDPKYKPNTPVSYPAIFGFEQIYWLHYDGNTTSVIERNIGQALGLGAVFEPKTFSSTIIPPNLNRLEMLAAKITPPAWPETLLGPIDAEKAARGKSLFESQCMKCHPPFQPGEMAKDLLFDLDEIGTDRGRAVTFTENLPDGKPYMDSLRDALAALKKRAYEEDKVPPAEQAEYERNRPVEWRANGKYAGRPLRAIWSSAPYLHNASVPTLHDLLLPAAERPKTFPIGDREYDPKKVGYTTEATSAPIFTFDISKPGNSNIGHAYGLLRVRGARSAQDQRRLATGRFAPYQV